MWLLSERLQVCHQIIRQRCLVMVSTITTIVLRAARLLLPQLAVCLIIVNFFICLLRQLYFLQRVRAQNQMAEFAVSVAVD